MRSSYRVGMLFGVPVGLNPSWFVAFALVTAVLALRVYPIAMPAREADLYWSMAIASGALFFLSILLHELAHSVVAKAFGIPVRGITLFILGGVSQISREAPRARQEFLMAFAGPATSLALAGLALAAWAAFGVDQTPLTVVLEWLWLMNFGLGAFNLLPGFPLDGGRVLRAMIWGMSGNYTGATRAAVYVGRAVAWGIVLYGAASLAFDDRFAWSAGSAAGLWLAAIGVLLDVMATGSWRQTRALLALRKRRVGEAAEPEWPQVAPFALLSDIEAEGLVGDDDDQVLVIEEGRVVGVVPGDRALAALHHDGATRAADAMIPAPRLSAIAPSATAMEAWERMEATDVAALPVVDGERFIGLVRRRRLLDLMRISGRGR